MNPEGALAAMEMADGINLLSFSSPEYVKRLAKSVASASDATRAFLSNAIVSLSGTCALNWDKSDLWHSLVAGLVVLPVRNVSLLTSDHLDMLGAVTGADNTAASQAALAGNIINTPPLAMVMLMRWLRMDLLELQKAFTATIAKRSASTTQRPA